MTQFFSLSPDQRPAPFNVIGESVTVLASGEQTGSYEIFIQSGLPDTGPPPHSHPWDEAYYVLDGALEVSTPSANLTLERGGFIHVPAGCVHRYTVRGGMTRFLSITSRPGAANFFADMNAKVGLPPDIPTVLAVAAAHAVAVAPPPGA